MTDRHGHDDRPGNERHEGLGHDGHPHAGEPSYDALLAGHDAHEEHEVFHGDHDDHKPGGPRHDPARRRRFIVLGVAVALLIGGIVLAFSVISPVVGGLLESKDYEGPGSGEVSVTVHQGDTGRDIATSLVGKGVVKTVESFEKALTDQPGDAIQPGTYTLNKEMKASDAVSRLRSGEARDEKVVTIREGLRATEIFAALSKGTGVPVADYEAAAKDPKALGLPAAAQGRLEGYLFPATYTFGPKVGAADQLKELVGQAKGRFSALGVDEAKMKDVVTIASIVEAEARMPQDRGKVAAVIENRLRIGMPLQMDSTVAYGVGKRALTTTDQERADDNPYNTYLHPGLPQGPINSPGAEAVKAAVDPPTGNWLYFVTVKPDTGETKFAATLDEHNANVREFQAYCQANPDKC